VYKNTHFHFTIATAISIPSTSKKCIWY